MDEKKIINYAKKNKAGFTARIVHGKIIPVMGSQSERYAVAGDTSIVYIPKEKNVQHYAPIKEGDYVDGWYDKSTGKYLIEKTNLYSNRKKALTVAKRRRQIAIFDLYKKQEIKLHYTKREHITGMRIKTVSKKKMGDYKGLHGLLPKNELPKRFRKISKKDVLIRAGQKDRKEVIEHERTEIPIMKKLMREGVPREKAYKEAHRKTNKILNKRKHRPVAYHCKRGYVNRLTGKLVSKSTAKRLNKFFDEHPRATLYEANKGAIYDRKLSWIDQDKRIQRIYKRENQIIKSKNRCGDDVYFSPLLNKRLSKKNAKKIKSYDYFENGFSVHLYRSTANKERIYHIIKYQVKRTLEQHEDIDRLEKKLLGNWWRDLARLIHDVDTKYPIGPRDYLSIVFSHLYYDVGYDRKDTGDVVCMHMKYARHNLNDLPDEIHKAMLKYHALKNEYNLIHVKEVIIYIFNVSNEKSRTTAEVRLGILGRGK